MDFELNEAEARVFGCLLEKQMTTPENYPLSLNTLLNACNQKSNRSPVVDYDENTVLNALSGLIDKKLVLKSDVGRVSKYEERFTRERNFVKRESAILCVLLLRGPQTAGELRSRTERMHQFTNLEAVNMTLAELEEMELITKLPKRPGRKEIRYIHRMSGDPQCDSPSEIAGVFSNEASRSVSGERDARISALEETVEALRIEVGALKRDFADFKKQFE